MYEYAYEYVALLYVICCIHQEELHIRDGLL